MGKISPVSSKYIIHASIEIEGVVERPDVIGAIFGQTEGLLGSDLELRELQRSGRIGRIEVSVDTHSGKTIGNIIIPSSLDKAETSIVAAALEIIQRIGPCNSKISVSKIEDIRISKRKIVIERAKELLKQMTYKVLPDSQELADEVAYSVRVMEITQYGKDRLAAGPSIDESDDIIVVEGRADVMNLLKHGFKNAIAINGTSCPETIKELTKRKTVTIFVDGDRGGNLIIKELCSVADIDYVAKAPDGKEVEEITKKEIHKALRSRITSEQAKLEIAGRDTSERIRPSNNFRKSQFTAPRRPIIRQETNVRTSPRFIKKSRIASEEEKKKFKNLLDDLIGTKGAYILDEKLNVLGKVPISELTTTIKSLGSGIFAVVCDGTIEKELVETAEKTNLKYLIGMDSKIRTANSRIRIFTASNLN